MRTLRSRLLAGYAALVLLTVVLASGASLLLFDLQGRYRGQADMATMALQLAATVGDRRRAEPGVDAGTVLSDAVRQSPFGRPPFAETLLVDGQGLVVAAPRRTSSIVIAARFRPGPIGSPDHPRIGLVQLADGLRMNFVAAPVADRRPDAPPRWVVVARPSREIRGLWRTMLPSSMLVGTIALVLAGIVSWFLARTITRPVEAMTAASALLAAGDYSVRVPDGDGQDEVSRLARAFNLMANDVGEAHRRQREFVANVGHDLRTPLTTVRGFAEALVDGTAHTPEQRANAVATIRASATRMADLVEELLMLARLEGQGAGLELAVVPVADIIAGATTASAGAARERHVRVHADVRGVGADGEPLAVRADATWLIRALANVLDNALRYAPRDSVVAVRARLEPAATSAGSATRFAPTDPLPPDGRRLPSASAEMVAIQVMDAGPGMPPDVAARAFERFFRADPARAAGNSGLGLAIAREIVEAHGGTIELTSEVGHGTRVTVRVPAAG